MKTISKKSRITTLCLVVATLFAVVSCDKPENESKQYTLHFAGEEVDIKPQLIEYGNHATAPENPERESSDFGGWFIDNGTFANKWDFETDVVTHDTTLYAKWELIKNYPIEIPFEDYSPLCQWHKTPNLPNLNRYGEVIIISSAEELNQYACTDNGYPEIDFSKYTVLLAHGIASSSVEANCSGLQQVSEQSYEMKVDLFLTNLTVYTYWQVLIIINKLDKEFSIELVVTSQAYKE